MPGIDARDPWVAGHAGVAAGRGPRPPLHDLVERRVTLREVRDRSGRVVCGVPDGEHTGAGRHGARILGSRQAPDQRGEWGLAGVRVVRRVSARTGAVATMVARAA